jgi:plastocyanin
MQEHHGGPETPGGGFKTWQIFVFSLIPLALVFAGVIGGSIHGSDSQREVFPTAAPPPPPPTGGPGGPGGATTLQITASNLQWNPRALTAPPETAVTVRMNNQDAVVHNFSVYRTNQGSGQIFMGELHTGPGIKDYTFTTPGPGSYFFRCDVHPDTMTGSFNVR